MSPRTIREFTPELADLSGSSGQNCPLELRHTLASLSTERALVLGG
jgi:hypothetical protein